METSPKVSSLPGASGSWNVSPSLTASPSPRVPPQGFAESMRAELAQFAQEVMEAVNGAADGEWIAGSEEEGRDLCAKMRQRVLERALQKRVDAAEAAFPPSARPDDEQAVGR